MDVFFETRTGKSFSIEIGFFDSVLEIKEKVQKYQGIPIARQALIFKGQSLEDDGNVEKCELLHNSHIQLIIAPPENPEKIEESPAAATTKILLILRMPTSSKKHVEMEVDDTILQLKEKINEVESMTNSRLSLYLHGNELHDNQSLRYYEITGNSEIDVVIKPPQTTTAMSSGGTINSKKLKLIVLTQCGTKKIPVEMNGSDNVGNLRKELQRLQEILHFHLPPEGYFFIYKQNVMDDDRSFRWHHVGTGDMIEIFNGSVTGGLS